MKRPIRVDDVDRLEIIKIQGELMQKRKRKVPQDEVVHELVIFYRKHMKP